MKRVNKSAAAAVAAAEPDLTIAPATPVAAPAVIKDKHWLAVTKAIAMLGVLEEEIRPESELAAALEMDSLDVVEMVMELEDKLAIEISDEVAETWKTAGDVAAYLRKRA